MTSKLNRAGWVTVLMILLAAIPVYAQDSGANQKSVVRAINGVVPLVETVGRYEKFEVKVDLDADFNNPYDPDDIRLDAQFTAPSGKSATVPGFYYRDFSLELTDASQNLTAAEDWSWRVRFAPDEVGEWSYQVLAATQASGTVSSEAQKFTVTESPKHGFIRVDSRNPHYMVFDDGTPYFPIGEDMSWYGAGGMADYRTWLDALHAANGNFIRVWMPSWAFGIEWSDTGLGNYDKRQDRAYLLDKLFEMVDERGIYVMLTLLNHGQFSVRVDTEWASNPYNAANGGPLNDPVEFATNPEAQRLWEQKLRYTAARWGYSANLLGWEWWNEVNWTPMSAAEILAPWAARSAAFLKPLDPYGHLITVSGSQLSDDAVWAEMDFTQNHKYNMTSLVREFGLDIPKWLDRYPGKPFLVGEFGSPSAYDVHGQLIHLGLWSAPMLGAAGSGMTWWWDTNVQANNLYYHFAALSAYFSGEDMAAHQWQPTQAALSKKAGATVYGLQDAQNMRLWMVSKNYNEQYLVRQYEKNISKRVSNPTNIQYPEVSGVALTLNGLADGSYTVEWWNTTTGEIIATEQVAVASTPATVNVPTFSTDLALKVRPISG